MAEPATESAGAVPTKAKLDELTKAAALQYSLKNFAAASEQYSRATEVQAELNGEMAPENAELLYYYGRALYKVAIATSDVLGGKVAQEEKKKSKTEKAMKSEAATEASSSTANGVKSEKEETVGSKPYFQLTGDENFTDSEDEDEATGEAEGAAEGEEEQDDFGNAFQVFDMARVLYTKQLEALGAGDDASKGKTKAEISPEGKLVRERLADCYNYLVDISFENENFHAAVPDARSALDIQLEFLDSWHPYITEAHYKLSLALEFASVSKIRAAQAEAEAGDAASTEQPEQEVDQELRNEAAQQMEFAIASLEARIKKEQAEVNEVPDDKKKEKMASVKDAEEMLEDMKARLVDLQADPKAQLDPTQGIDQTVFQGLLGGLLGSDPSVQKAKLEEATKSANDISGLVRTRKKEPAAAPAPAAGLADNSSGKRKLEVEEGEQNGKRAKTEEIS